MSLFVSFRPFFSSRPIRPVMRRISVFNLNLCDEKILIAAHLRAGTRRFVLFLTRSVRLL
jgi:hypothetical protein